MQLKVLGLSDGDVAREIGVNRVTVWRWRTFDLDFEVRMNELHKDLVASMRAGLLELGMRAMDVTRRRLDNGSWPAAERMLQIIGPALMRGAVGERPTSRSELLALHAMKLDRRRQLDELTKPEARLAVAKHLRAAADTEAPEEFVDQCLRNAEKRLPSAQVQAPLDARGLYRIALAVDERVLFLVRAMWISRMKKLSLTPTFS
ncbi:hypothetical protein BH20ACT24_BH20ACT24_19320 [soil metagenome]